MKLRQRMLAVAVAVGVVAIAAGITLALMRDAEQPVSQPGPETTRTLGTLEATPAPFPDEQPPTGLGVTGAPVLEATPEKLREFDIDAAMADIRALEAFGPRKGGSEAEARAAAFLRDRLTAMGLDARIEEFPLPDGSTSRNVVATLKGSSDAVIVLGAHFDTKPPSPGANDNASGCAALLEIARILTERPAVPTVEFVFFGSEETSGGDPNGHHFGSRYRVSQMSQQQRQATAGMISVDMIGYGPNFHSRTMGKGPLVLSDMLLGHAKTLGIGMTYSRDPGPSGWSDHEPYELAGMPVAWIEWRDDPVYHTAGDISTHLQPGRIQTAGRLVLDFVRSLDEATLDRLIAR